MTLRRSTAIRATMTMLLIAVTSVTTQAQDTLFGDARKLHDQEYSDLRQLLADDQRATFDANVLRRRADDDKEAAARRERQLTTLRHAV